MAGTKTDKVELEKRIRSVQEWILQDTASNDIITQCVRIWGVSKRQAQRYIWAANLFFQEKTQLSVDRKVAVYVARKKKLLRDMDPVLRKTPAGVMAANKVIDSMAKLEGISMKTVKHIGDPDKPVHTVTQSPLASNIDYSKLPTEFLLMLWDSRAMIHG